MSSADRSDSTRERVVAAALTEFSRHGAAGARIDRIATQARTSKERVYAYFRSKEELYGFVFVRVLDGVAEATHLDPTDLPGYAVRVHDYYLDHPEAHRLMRWSQLASAGSGGRQSGAATVDRKVEAIRRAQQDGLLDSEWEPIDVLVFVNQIAGAWADNIALAPGDDTRGSFLDSRRAAIRNAVAKLFPPVVVSSDK